jgi:uncharacterized protein
VDDVTAMRLVLDNLQAKQATKELQTAEDVLPRVARECYKWLLCPSQDSPTATKPTVEAFPVNTSGAALGSEIERICLENEWVIVTWSPIHLRTRMQTLYWKADKPAFGAMAFWEDTLRYIYLPRLKSRAVLEQAIVKGAGSEDFFGTAYGQHDSKFDGFNLGNANVQLDDTLLLIEPAAAKQYEAGLRVMVKPIEIATEGIPAPVSVAGGEFTPSPPAVGPAPISVPPARKPRAFHGSVEVNATTAKLRLVELAEEIISNLAADPQAELRITVEISAEFPAGVSDQIRRAVSENAKSLGFKSLMWE